MEMALVPHDAPDGGVQYVLSGKGADFPMSEGIGGGHPGRRNRYVWVHNNEAADKGSNIDFATTTSLDDLPGEKQAIGWGVFPLLRKDALYIRWNGGGGYGDPLDRDPQAVARDVVEGLVSEDVARETYGVVLGDGAAVNAAMTARQREILRRARMTATAAE